MVKLVNCLIFSIVLAISVPVSGQECLDYHKKADCSMDKQKGYQIYSQSKSARISLNEILEFNIVFYGQKEYIFSFCTSSHLYPVHFRLIDPGTKDVLYDNEDDRYIGSIGIGFDVTKTLMIEIKVLAQTATTDDQKNNPGCLGLLLQYKSY